MEPAEAPGDSPSENRPPNGDEASIIVHRGTLPESWFPEWLFRRKSHHTARTSPLPHN